MQWRCPMSKTNELATKWNGFYQKVQPVLSKIGAVWNKICEICGLICDWIIKLRKILLVIPVAVAAIYLAMMNSEKLPEMVGIGLLENGDFAYVVARSVAVNIPLALTGACLLLMIFSRKTVYPWIISVFTLILPPLILLFNNFLG